MWNKNTITKTCSKCKRELPATKEFFYTKNMKYKLSNGVIKSYTCLRFVCKECNGNLGLSLVRKKRCAELKCTLDNYQDSWKKALGYKKLKFKELANMSSDDRQDVLRKYRATGKFMTKEQYSEYLYNIRSISSFNRRKYDYGDAKRVTHQMRNQMNLLHMTDSRIALIMGMPVKDVPKEILEFKRVLIKLKREAGLTHSTKPIKTKI